MNNKYPTQNSQSGVGSLLGYTGGLGQSAVDTAIIEAVESGSEVGLLPLFSILPDPNQPRDLLPKNLYERLFAGETPPTIMQTWLAQTKNDGVSPAQKQAIAALQKLAQTIAQHDLIQPIAVCEAGTLVTEVPEGVDHIIVAGERRWWAHVLLYLQDKSIKDRESDHIKAITLPVDSNIRALQLIENTMRENLSALERAHGLLALRQEMSQGKSKPVPWAHVERELGIGRPHRWRIEQVLNLCDEAQEIVRWHGLSESAIRPVTTNKEMQKHPKLQVLALKKLVIWQEANEESGHQRLADFVKRLLTSKSKQPSPVLSPDPVKLGQTFRQRARTMLKVFDDLDDGKMLQIAESMREDIEAQNELISLENKIARMRQHWER